VLRMPVPRSFPNHRRGQYRETNQAETQLLRSASGIVLEYGQRSIDTQWPSDLSNAINACDVFSSSEGSGILSPILKSVLQSSRLDSGLPCSKRASQLRLDLLAGP
jgi:hypothetical protein